MFALLGAAAVLLGIAAAAHNFVTGQIGWNTAFTIAQTVVAAAEYGADEQLAAQGAAISTLACFVVTPVLMLLL